MRGQDLYEALGRVDPAMLDAAAETPRQRRIWRRPAVIAACAALLLAGTAVAVFCGVEIRMLDAADPETYASSGKLTAEADAVFQVAGQVEDTPVEAFSDQLLEDAAAGERYRSFDTWEEAMAYAGVEASGPAGQTDVTVTLENGRVAQVSLRAGGSSAGFDYQNTPAVSTYTASFFTESCTEDRGNCYFFYDLEVIEQETISTAGGETAQLILTQSRQGGGMACGFLARGRVLYSVDVLYLPGQAEQAMETLVTALNGI
ncbi:hypothetical protein [Dysosmobacter sp.]|uniref:hypothetical protein n=1 Tax=Dysosmobacter sp. TaxID=2591382 RepID=UPI002A954037|nr:hypothetical protein [Dysosmobacter sp.]MCI6054289.1 hypothetical protein [Dysosmobacter sp.]MDY5508844.1 hypothetical protein [Dysosmobacter sp.]